jgi:fibronectin type 3 domain-containing protein
VPKGHGDAGAPAVTVSGLSPTNIESVYGFSTSPSAGGGETIAVVDAYDDPTAAADLANFSAQWSLPACATTGPNPCLTKVNETGGTSLPASGTNLAEGWDLEISLDIEWAHAVAPGARILLVEASSSNLGDLLTAEQYAGAHANYVTNSWGATEFNGEAAYDSDFSGSASYFAATGDVASEVDYPATSPNVVAVGGTSLKFTSGGAFSSETAWSDGGGGCSAYESATSSGQSTFSQYAQAGCNGKRAVPDVSLDADPASGVAVYDSTPYCPSSCSTGWYTVGGTSVATPIWAAESAVAGISATPPTIYSSSTPSFRDVTGGSNGHPTLVGYDLATGRGSWADGISGAPSGLTATGSNGQVALSWTAASGATSYNVYRGTSANGLSTTPIATVTGTTFGDTSVTNGTPYYYEVEGVNSLGTGSPSNEATATPSASIPSPPPSAPPAPTGLSASATSGGVNLAWTGATGATSYEVLRGTSSGTETKLVSGVTGTTYDDTSVSSGNTYYYEVEGVKSGVTGAPSNEAKAVVASHISASISKSCSGSSCTFTSTSTDSGGTITTYSWTVSGATGSGSTFAHTFTSANTYTVALKLADNKGSTASASVNVSCVQSRSSIFRFSSSQLSCS